MPALSLRDHTVHRYLLERFGCLLEVAHKCWLKDAEFRFVGVSAGFADQLGLPPRDILQQCDEQFFSAAEIDQFHNDDLQVIRRGQPIVVQECDPCGEWAETTKIPLRDRTGRIVGTAGFARGITHWKRLELQMAALLARGGLDPASAAEAGIAAQPVASSRCAAWLWRVREELDVAFATRISVPRLSAKAGVHPDYLSRAFREHFGMPIRDYLKRRRVEHAAQLLAGSSEPIAAVAAACGFADQSHLTRVFHQVLGVSPGRFRRSGAAAPTDGEAP